MAGVPPISASDVRAAIRKIGAVPTYRRSRRYCLAVGRQHYPPKYILGLAARRASGRELRPEEFSGGPPTNRLLEELGFRVIACPCGGLPRRLLARSPHTPTRGTVTPIARVVVVGKPPATPEAAEKALVTALKRFPDGRHAKFLITPGGFVRARWPSEWSGRSGWSSRKEDLRLPLEAAMAAARAAISPRVLRQGKGKVSVLTLGVDVKEGNWGEHAEFVGVYDLKRKRFVRWTGKSYPVGWQERSLVQVADLKSHFLKIAGERALILGCHDLNMWSPRGRVHQLPATPRRRRCDNMRRLVSRFRPTVVLHHPHSIDHPNIWRPGWSELRRRHSGIKAWASGISHRHWKPGRRPRWRGSTRDSRARLFRKSCRTIPERPRPGRRR